MAARHDTKCVFVRQHHTDRWVQSDSGIPSRFIRTDNEHLIEVAIRLTRGMN
jgi:hypothetical protein